MWPLLLLAIVSGVAFDLVKWVVADVRRRIYNGNRNRKYAEGRRGRRNMAWRTVGARDWRAAPLPVPEGFAEGVCRQWDRVRDSTVEVVRFGELMVELEGYVDSSYIFNEEGDVVGRHPGIKGFLAAHCPHIGYGVAIRYRLLAMKARVAGGRVPVQCRSVCELEGRLDGCLGVVRRRLDRPRRMCRRPRRECGLQGVIFSLREAVRPVGKLDVSRRRRVVVALREIARELAVS